MFARATPAFVLALPVFAAASVLPRTDGGGPSNQCNTASTYCCNKAVQPYDPSISTILGLLGIVVGSLTDLVGVTCSPLSAIGGGTSCGPQPVCCTGNNFSGLVVIGCTPITIVL